MEVLRWVLQFLHFIVSIGLMLLVASQTSRHEGLGAVGGGTSSPVQRGRQGMEEQLITYTKYTAVAFMALSLLLYVLGRKFGWT